MFNIGQNVIYILSGNEATIIGKNKTWGGNVYDISMNGCIYNGIVESDLRSNDFPTNPFEQLQQQIFGNNLEFCERNTSFKIKNSSNNTISTLYGKNHSTRHKRIYYSNK